MKYLPLVLLVMLLTTAQAQRYGINIKTPSRAKLEVHGGVDRTVGLFGGESAGISVQKTVPAIGFNSYYRSGHRFIANGFAGMQYVDQADGSFAFDLFGAGTTNAFAPAPKRLLSATRYGAVQIGSRIYDATLSVDRNPGVEATAYFFGKVHHTAFNFGYWEDTYIRGGSDGATVFINDIEKGKVVIQGPVGINTQTPLFPLEIRQYDNTGMRIVNYSNIAYWEWAVENNNNLLLHNNGQAYGRFLYNNGFYSVTSDARLKSGIVPLPSTLGPVLQLRPVTYQMIKEEATSDKTIGFIAQEVKSLFPEAVEIATGVDPEYKSIHDLHSLSYNTIGVFTVKAVQEQQAMIDSNENRLKAVQSLLSKIDSITKRTK